MKKFINDIDKSLIWPVKEKLVTATQGIDEIYNSIISCHPSREDDIKNKEAIKFLAKRIDMLTCNGSGIVKTK